MSKIVPMSHEFQEINLNKVSKKKAPLCCKRNIFLRDWLTDCRLLYEFLSAPPKSIGQRASRTRRSLRRAPSILLVNKISLALCARDRQRDIFMRFSPRFACVTEIRTIHFERASGSIATGVTRSAHLKGC
jgi:hypothetical protein